MCPILDATQNLESTSEFFQVLFRAGACSLFLITFWLTYTDGFCANAMLKQLRGMRRFVPRSDPTSNLGEYITPS